MIETCKSYNKIYVEEVFWRLFETTYRKSNRPKTIDSRGIERGYWEDNYFSFYDSYVPTNFNKEKRTIKEIKVQLKNEYAISFSSIPFVNGRMDFSQVAIAIVELEDIIVDFYKFFPPENENPIDLNGFLDKNLESLPLDDLEKCYAYVFQPTNRNANFNIADRITANRHMFVPGLGKDYSPEDLKKWRKENHFTWHESFNGYYLVPSVIHGNISHSGLVSRQQGLSVTAEESKLV